MITNLVNKDIWPSKRNWIDQNNVVFGYDDTQDCCEGWGWGVFDPVTRERVADDPHGLPYHFDFEKGAKNIEAPSCSFNGDGEKILKDAGIYHSDHGSWDVFVIVQVELVSDADPEKRLVFECWLDHNGYYYHDFSFEKKDELGNPETVEDIVKQMEENAPPLPGHHDCEEIVAHYAKRLRCALEREKVIKKAEEGELPI